MAASQGGDPLAGLSPKLVQYTVIEADGQDVSDEFDGAIPDSNRRRYNAESRMGQREFEPLVVTRLGGTLPWDTSSTQLQCGKTVTDNNGDKSIRLNYECVATQTQFAQLQQMRADPSDIRLVSRAYTGPVTFDEMTFDRVPDANGAVVRGEGVTNEPIYTIQLQSKETNDDTTIGGDN